jgi:hypothetical protein
MVLTVRQVEKLRTPGRYLDEHGLYLQVMSPTNRSWILRFQREGRERWAGLAERYPGASSREASEGPESDLGGQEAGGEETRAGDSPRAAVEPST